eukprot:3890512-Prymnesium_polylepis.2
MRMMPRLERPVCSELPRSRCLCTVQRSEASGEAEDRAERRRAWSMRHGQVWRTGHWGRTQLGNKRLASVGVRLRDLRVGATLHPAPSSLAVC